ncbi:MAG: hypothetical protein VB118_08045 [Oscillospiraceae bacterium]|nr:hypothetical protein [Oscillospiraceae bacterium]
MKITDKTLRFAIPLTKDPYVNTMLYPAGKEKDTGLDRYFISSWNANVGSTGLLFNENGDAREFRFRRDATSSLAQCGFYSACYAGNDIMWLAGDLAQIYRLELDTGKLTGFMTGAPSNLVFAGMVYDELTGKLFFSAYCPPREVSVSFDTRTGKTAKIYDGVFEATTSRGSFPNGDGTYSIDYTMAGLGKTTLGIWDPKNETFLSGIKTEGGFLYGSPVRDARGRILNSVSGWYDPKTGAFTKENMPDKSAYWFERRENEMFGAYGCGKNDKTYICSYSLETKEINELCSFEDGIPAGIRMTGAGDFIAVTRYGDFYKFACSGELIKATGPHGMSLGTVDCLFRSSSGIIVGTPFITQRFWTYDPETKTGKDAGRAAPGGGEVLQVDEIKEKIYMASYTQGILTEYDPKLPGMFPENPRIAARPAHSMRPVCHTTGKDRFYWSSNHEYGHAGCEISSYDANMGCLVTNDDPIKGQHFYSLFYNKKHDVLIGSSYYHTDCGIAKPLSDRCFIALFDADTLGLIKSIELPEGVSSAPILGQCESDDEYLVMEYYSSGNICSRILTFSQKDFSLSEPVEESDVRGIVKYTGKPGWFCSLCGGKAELWRYDQKVCGRMEIASNPGFTGIFTSPGCVVCVTKEEAFLFELE